jgi:hypothetical protein
MLRAKMAAPFLKNAKKLHQNMAIILHHMISYDGLGHHMMGWGHHMMGGATI